MKFMLNGAPTLGTLDGANVEIAECAGIENEYIFGAKVEDIERMKKEGYHPKALYDANPEIKRVVDTLIDGTFDDGGAQGEGDFKELHDSLLKDSSWQKADNYFLIYDLPDYVDTKIELTQSMLTVRNSVRSALSTLQMQVSSHPTVQSSSMLRKSGTHLTRSNLLKGFTLNICA